jgi:hypothetical protein
MAISLSEALLRDDGCKEISMNRCLHFSLLVTLSMAIGEPVFANAVIAEPAAQGSRHLESRLALGPLQVSSPQASSARPWKAGNETATMPWSAPVGHHQPRAVDLPSTSAARQTPDEADAKLDRKIRDICQGCLPRG